MNRFAYFAFVRCRGIALLVLALGGGAVPGQEVRQNGPATVTLDVKASNGMLESAYEQITVTLSVEGSPGLKVDVPRRLTAGNAWHDFPKGPPTETALQAGRVRWQRTYALDPVVPGVLELRLQPIRIHEGDREQILEWKPWQVHVQKPSKETDLTSLRGNTGIEDATSPPPEPPLWPWLAGGAAAILLIVVLLLWRRGRWRLCGPLTAEQWAQRELDRLLLLDLPARNQLERFHTLLSNIVRRFLEKRFRLRARRQTTPEFLQTMMSDARFSPEQQQFLRDFLERCDIAKFSGVPPSPADCRALADRAREFIKNAGCPHTAAQDG